MRKKMEQRCIYCKHYIAQKQIMFGLGMTEQECKKNKLKNKKYPYGYRCFVENNDCPCFEKSGLRYFLWKGKGYGRGCGRGCRRGNGRGRGYERRI